MCIRDRIQAMQILKGVNGIGKIEFTKKDIVRHKLVQRDVYKRQLIGLVKDIID